MGTNDPHSVGGSGGSLSLDEVAICKVVFTAFRDAGGAGLDALELFHLASSDERRAITAGIRERFERIASLSTHAVAALRAAQKGQ